MIYLERPAPAGLEASVHRVWFLEMERARPYEKILPQPWIHLIVNLSTPYRLFDRGGRPMTVADAFVAGVHDEYLVIELPELVRHVGVELEPDGLGTISESPSSDVVRRVVPADGVFEGIAGLATGLREGADTSTPEETLDAFGAFLAGARRPDHERDPLTSAVLDALRQDPSMPVGDVARSLAVSHRTLIARFASATGMTPKTYAQLWRFHTLVGALDPDAADWADLAVRSQYYDQAHVIRAFRRFTGWTPSEYLRRVREHGLDAARFVPLEEVPRDGDQPARS